MSDRVVVLTRRPEDNAALAAEIRGRGYEALEIPCVRTERLDDESELTSAMAGLTPADILVLTSRAGVDAVVGVLPRGGIACAVAAVGPAATERARAAGFDVVFTATIADSRVLGGELPIPDGRVVLARSDLADPDLPRILRDRGATVREVTAYRTVGEASGDVAAVRTALERGGVTVVVASPSAVNAVTTAVGPVALRRARFVAIGERTARAVRERIGVEAIVSDRTDTAALAAALAPTLQEVSP